MDFFTVPTLTFGVLYCFFVIGHDRRSRSVTQRTFCPSCLYKGSSTVNSIRNRPRNSGDSRSVRRRHSHAALWFDKEVLVTVAGELHKMRCTCR